MTMMWANEYFWLASFVFMIITGVVSGSYPALYLSSFQPIKVLKGTFHSLGRTATLPRKVLVVLQFTISISLIVGVMVVNRQIQHARHRPVGYDKERLLSVKVSNDVIHNRIDAVADELVKSGYVTEVAESLNPVTMVGFVMNGYDWTGTGPDLQSGFPTVYVSHNYGKAVGWQFIGGRDFSKDIASDTAAIVLNEAALKYMNLTNPIGKTIRWTIFDKTKTFTVIGVIRDMLMESPYYAIRKTIYMLDTDRENFVNVRMAENVGVQKAVAEVESVFKKFNPAVPFEFSFVEEEFDRKFGEEENIRELGSVFAGLAIFISCLGIFGLASFVAAQRTKEIGIRKVLGASVARIWRMLAADFVILVSISILISIPVTWYLMTDWLQRFEYRTELSWSIFLYASSATLLITLATVSFQSVKAALANPVGSLKSE